MVNGFELLALPSALAARDAPHQCRLCKAKAVLQQAKPFSQLYLGQARRPRFTPKATFYFWLFRLNGQ
jgi:hypothetical protein